MMSERKPEEVKRLRKIVENPDFKTASDVEEFFVAYTKYIWNYKMVGLIYDYYAEDTVIHGENGKDIVGIKPIVFHTLERLYAVPDIKLNFIDIFADKVSDD